MTEEVASRLLPHVIASVSGLEMKARTVVEGFLQGLHRSPYKGFSIEFAEHRPYFHGDDPRYIDWKAFGKTDRLFVKQYEQETNLRCWLLLDASASMAYGTGALRKFDYAAVAATALAYLALGQGESVGLALFDHALHTFVPARHNPAHFHAIHERIELAEPKGETNMKAVLTDLAPRIKRRGLVVLFSDLFDADEAVDRALKFLRHRGHEVIVFHVLDPTEVELSVNEPMIFEDMETGGQFPVEPNTLHGIYRSQIENFLRGRRQVCGELGVDYVSLRTDERLDKTLAAYLAWRGRRQ